MNASFWRSRFAPRNLTHTSRLSSGDLWGSMFWLSAGVGFLLAEMQVSWVWALLVVGVLGVLLACLGGYYAFVATHGWSLLVRVTVAMFLGTGTGWGAGVVFSPSFCLPDPGQVCALLRIPASSWMHVLLLSCAVCLVPLFAWMLHQMSDEVVVAESRSENTHLLDMSCFSTIFLLFLPAFLLLVLIVGLHISPFYPWLMGPNAWVVLPVGEGLFAALALSMGGSVAFHVLQWSLTQ